MKSKHNRKSPDEAYKQWIQRQPSCLSGQFSEYVNGEGRCVAAHIRHVSKGSGIGLKPVWRIVPVTNEEHMNMHRVGDSYYAEPEWWDKQIEKYIKMWESSMKNI